MDLKLLLAVIKRFKWLVGAGAVISIALAILAYGTPTFIHGKPGLRPRSTKTWQAAAEVLISQPDDPYGQSATPSNGGVESYLASLSPVYAAQANADAVQRLVRKSAAAPQGLLQAADVVDPQTGDVLPLITLTSYASTSAAAGRMASAASRVLQNYIAQEQTAADIPTSQRTHLVVIKNGLPPTVAKGYDVTTPMLVLVGVFVAFLALAFILENLRPRTAAAYLAANGVAVSDGVSKSDLPVVPARTTGNGNGHHPEEHDALVGSGQSRLSEHRLDAPPGSETATEPWLREMSQELESE